MIAALVETGALLTVVYSSLIAGVGVCAAYAFVVIGVTKSVEHRRADHRVAATLYTALATIAAAACAAAAVAGIAIITTN